MEDDLEIENTVRNLILEKFPNLGISIYSEYGNKIVEIDDYEVYRNSEEFHKLVLDIKMNILWNNGILHYLFVSK